MTHTVWTNPPQNSPVNTCLVPIIVGGVLLSAITVVPVSGTHSPDPSSHFLVEVESDGSATVSLIRTYDLTTQAQRDAFTSIETDDATITDLRDRFLVRMQSVAAAASTEAGREMTVSNPTVQVSRTADGETGVITMRVSWSNIATPENGELIVTEPFASGFTPQHEFVLTAPDGYHIIEASPEPDTFESSQVTWSSRTNLDDYRVVITEQQDSQTPGQSGFGLLVGLMAVTAAIVFRALW